MELGRKMGNTMSFTCCPYRSRFCSKARPALLNLKQAQKRGGIEKMKFLIALLTTHVFKWKETKPCIKALYHSNVWIIWWILKDFFGNAVSG